MLYDKTGGGDERADQWTTAKTSQDEYSLLYNIHFSPSRPLNIHALEDGALVSGLLLTTARHSAHGRAR